MKIREIYDILDRFADFSSQEEWDNSGMLIGGGKDECSGVLITLDVTADAIKKAAEKNCNLIISHHPVIFRAIKKIGDTNPVYAAIQNGISVISVHTPLDGCDGGINDELCRLLGLKNIRKTAAPFMRIGETDEKTAEEFARFVNEKLGTHCTVSRGFTKKIKTVAVVGGSAGEFYEDALSEGADAFVTGEAKHHEFIYAAADGILLCAAGHHETENLPAVTAISNLLKKEVPELRTEIFDSCPVDRHYGT